jgi:nucleotide-binding universal stress UspA family protein
MRIVYATDSGEDSLGAARATAQLEHDLGATVTVIRALEPVPVYGQASTHLLWFPEAMPSDEWRSLAEREVRGLLDAAGLPDYWPVRVEVGPVPLVIAREADREGADLLVMGAGRHDRLDRWFGTETALRVMQIAHVPVLAVPLDSWNPPRVIVAATDFSDFSRDALGAALRLAAPEATVHLVHVLPDPRDFSTYYGIDWNEAYKSQLGEQLRQWGADNIGSGVRIEPHLLEGRVAPEVLELGRRVGADLLVAGSHGTGFIGRLVLGSVSSRLLRGAACAVLIAPPKERASELESTR